MITKKQRDYCDKCGDYFPYTDGEPHSAKELPLFILEEEPLDIEDVVCEFCFDELTERYLEE